MLAPVCTCILEILLQLLDSLPKLFDFSVQVKVELVSFVLKGTVPGGTGGEHKLKLNQSRLT